MRWLRWRCCDNQSNLQRNIVIFCFQELAKLQKDADRLAAEEVRHKRLPPQSRDRVPQVQQLAVMEELKQQMLQRQQQAELLTVELKVVRAERYGCVKYETVFR